MKQRYVRWMVRTAFVHLVAGTLLGLGMMLGARVAALAPLMALRSTHVHLILVGFVMQLIMGVALWMFPRRVSPPRWPTERQGFLVYALLNAGVVARTAGAPLAPASDAAFVLHAAGGALQVAAIAAFVALMAGRVRGPAETPTPGRRPGARMGQRPD